jgi:hypothetical protein
MVNKVQFWGEVMNRSRVKKSAGVGWIASLMRQLLQEVRVAPVSVGARVRVAGIHSRSVGRLEQRLALAVVEELEGIAVPFCGLERGGVWTGNARGSLFNRVDRLLDTIETAQFGQQRQRDRRRQRLEAKAANGSTKPGDIKAEVTPGLGDFVRDFVRIPGGSPPAGSVALDVTCDVHPGRLMRLWMSRRAKSVTLFGGEGRTGAWDTDTSGRGAVLVACPERGCQRSARLNNDWLVARLRQVRTNFEAGKGLPMAWIPLSHVGESAAES